MKDKNNGVETKGHHNRKVAQNRGSKWKMSLKVGKMDAVLNPSTVAVIRVKKNLSQEDVARRLKITTNTYGSAERGKRPVKKDRAIAIAGILQLSVSQLFTALPKNKFIVRKYARV
jgi:DNA-binding XRE family transcriptional regulator